MATLGGTLKWLGVQALGAAIGVPLGVIVGLQAAFHPFKAWRNKYAGAEPLPDPLPGLVHEWLNVNGTRLHLVRTCANPGGSKPVLLLLHGFPEGWFSWRRQMEALSREGWCVAALDMRGYGGSAKPQDVSSYRIEPLVADVVGVIRAIAPPSTGRVVLGGHDSGGFVAWHVAHLHPELVERLAVLCIPHPACFIPNLDWDQLKRSWYMFLFQMPWVPEAMLLFDSCAGVGAAFTAGPGGCRNPEALSQQDIERYKQAFALPGAARASLNYYRAAAHYMIRAPNPEVQRAVRQKLQMPVLLLWADHDTALGPQLLRGTERYAERLSVHILQDSSHWAQQDRWEEVNRLLLEFLSKERS